MRYPGWLKRFTDRRRSPRMRVNNILAVYWEGLPDCSHPVTEISLEGARIETGVSWTKGTLIRLNLSSMLYNEPPGRSDTMLNLWSRVVRQMPDGLCVEFVFESREERRELGRFLRGLNGKNISGHENAKIAKTTLRWPGDD